MAVKLHIHKAQAIGHLQYLWWWALDYAPNGDLSAFTSAEISAASEWPGDVENFCKALADGWIDQNGALHDWHIYAGRLIESRKKDAERKKTIRRTSAGRPPDIGGTADVPNPTVPTKPKASPADKSAVGRLQGLFTDLLAKEAPEARFNYGQLGAILKRRLAEMPEPDVAQRIRNWFASTDPWVRSNLNNVGVMEQRLHLLKDEPIHGRTDERRGAVRPGENGETHGGKYTDLTIR